MIVGLVPILDLIVTSRRGNASPDFWLGLDNARRLWEKRRDKTHESEKLEDCLRRFA